MRGHLPLVALFVALLIIHPDPRGGVAPPEARRWQQGPWPVACRQPLRLAAVAPHPVATVGQADWPQAVHLASRVLLRGHEWVAVHNPGPVAVRLDGWLLRTGRGRRGHLPPLTVGPGATQLLPLARSASLRLADSGGTLSVVDPCGHIRDTFTWGEAPEGMAFVRSAWRPGAEGGPDVAAVPASSVAPRSLADIELMLTAPRPAWQASSPPARREGRP
jgi:hypothetical protein